MDKWISLKSWRAPADGVVRHHAANRVGAAGIDARIHALLPHTRPVPLALTVVYALGSAVGRLAEIAGLAAAHAGSVDHAFAAVGAAVAV